MNKYKKLYNDSVTYIGILQVEKEIISFMEYLDSLKPKNVLEIGVCQGGSFYLWSKLLDPTAKKLGIDLPNGAWGVNYVRSDTEIAIVKHNIEMFAPNIEILHAESTKQTSIDWIKKQLGEEKLDFLFIDADHTYEGVKKDYLNYKNFVRPGGIIAFHDIKESDMHKEKDCTVYKFWQELEGNKQEFIDNNFQWGGIGVIKV